MTNARVRSRPTLRILAADSDLLAAAGRQRGFVDLVRGLADRGHSMDVFFRHSGPLKETLPEDCRPVQVPGFLEQRSIAGSERLRLMGSVLVSLRWRHDLVFVNRPALSPFAVAVGAVKRVPSFCFLRDHRFGYSDRARTTLRRVGNLIAMSNFLRDHYVRDLGMDPERVQVVYSGLDTSYYRPTDVQGRATARSHLGLPQDAFVILYAGRIDKTKGVDILVDAFDILAPRVGKAHLVIAGGPDIATDTGQPKPEGVSYLRDLQRTTSPDRCTWVGHRIDVRPLYLAADVAVVPSRWGEPFGRAVIEPMSCGIPVIASADGGIPEALGTEFSGFLFDVEDVAALAEKLIRLHDWRERTPQLGKACREHVERSFPVENELESVERLFTDAVRRRRHLTSAT